MIASGFSWMALLPGIEAGEGFPAIGHKMGALVTAWLVCFVLLALAAVARAQLAKATARGGLEAYVPDEGLTVRGFAEAIVEAIAGVMGSVLAPRDVKSFLPLVGGLMVYIFSCNILAIIPGFQPPTHGIDANLGMSLIVLVAYWWVGISRDAKSFFKHMAGPSLMLIVLILPIELITMLLARPASLAVRLTGNIFGDHTVFTIMSDLVPYGVPAIFLALATLVSLIQAFVFGLLTTVYIMLSLPHGEHHDDDGHELHPAH